MAISSQPSASEINVELGRASNAPFDINGTEERTLAGKPSGAISFSDFIGKSAAKTYADFLAYLQAQANGTTTFISRINQLNQNWWYEVTDQQYYGTMYGSPYSNNGWTSSDSHITRAMQHMCETQAEYQAIIDNDWHCGFLRGGYANSILVATNKNGYNSLSYGILDPSTNNLQFEWWDGTKAWYRYANQPRTEIQL